MIRTRRATPFLLCLPIVAALLAVDCQSSPTAPSLSVVGISLTTTTFAVGTTATATVALSTGAPSGGMTVALTSSNPAAATVPATVLVDAGASTATVAITGVAAGAATITATAGTSHAQSAPLTITNSAAVVSVTVSPTSVVGGNAAVGTVTLNGPAPSGGAIVALSSADPASTPPTVTVPAGQTSMTFTVSTRAVGGTLSSTVSGTYGGVTMSTMLSVTPFMATVATANFGVTGPSETETCELSNSGATLNCTFNGSTSSAPGTITEWDWTYGVSKIFQQTTSGPILTKPTVDCSMIPPPPLPVSPGWFTMIVTLTIHDSLGNVSTASTDAGVRLLPQGSCGF